MGKELLLKINGYCLWKYPDNTLNYVDVEGKKVDYDFHIGTSRNGGHFGNALLQCYKNTDSLDTLFKEFRDSVKKDQEYRREYILLKRRYSRVRTISYQNVECKVLEEYQDAKFKRATYYFNNRPLRYPDGFPHDYQVTIADIELKLHTGVLSNNYSFTPIKNLVELPKITVPRNISPLHLLLGYRVKLRNEMFDIINLRVYSSDSEANTITVTTELQDRVLTLQDIRELEVVGELNGPRSLSALINKLKFME